MEEGKTEQGGMEGGRGEGRERWRHEDRQAGLETKGTFILFASSEE